MKLRALHLENVRRFAGQRASITGIGDGITVVAEPNEFGKSTFFDALHALFFEKHSARPRHVQGLQPYAGGAVTVAADVETDAGLFRLEKRFLSRASARVLRQPDGAVIAQEDEAERWIATLLGAGGKGPAGLLWVRQGQLGLEPDKPAEKAELTETRRDLLSSVAGEIDAMTGGRRMDRVMRQVSADLGQITTRTGRPTGPWKEARDTLAALEERLSELDAQMAQLDTALHARTEAEAQLQRLSDPQAEARRRAALTQAQEAMQAAQAHAARRRAAQDARDLAAASARAARDALGRFQAALETLTQAEAAAHGAAETARTAAQDLAACQTRLEQAQTARATAATAQEAAQKALESAHVQIAARKARDEAKALTQRLQRIDAALRSRDTLRAQLKAHPATPDWLARTEAAQAALDQAENALAAQATTLRARYTGTARITRNGAPLPEGEVLLQGASVLDLPGIGQLAITAPVQGSDGTARLAEAEAALQALLDRAEVSDIAAARALAARRREMSQQADSAQLVMDTLAPEGPDPLRAALAEAELAAARAHDDPLPALESLQAKLDEARRALTRAEDNLTAARDAHADARAADSAARAHALAAAQTLDRARAEAAPPETRDTRRGTLLAEVAQAEAALETAQADLDRLSAEAPDLDTLEAELTRAAQAIETTERQRNATAEQLAALSSEIRTLAGNGIEERRDTLAGETEAARQHEARLSRRANALTRLRDALEAERSAAQDAYFGPVQQELAPLLSILHADAALSFDSDSLLPAGLTRGETEESFDALSGGTREQIAILTRLAFARLFARQGQHLPIILDDALVFSDDARIMRMFTALTRVARDQQIIVLTCRQLAFQDLGGARPGISLD